MSDYIGLKLFAIRLDEQFIAILNETFIKNMNSNVYIIPLFNKFKPELDSLVYVIYYYLSIVLNKPTPGMRALNISNINNNDYIKRVSKYLIVVLSIISYSRLKHMSVLEGWRGEEQNSMKRLLWKSLHAIELIFKILGLSNFLTFIRYGRYPNLMHRIFSYEMIPNSNISNEGLSRYVNYKGRQWMWQLGISILTALSLMRNWNEVDLVYNGINQAGQYVVNIINFIYNNSIKYVDPLYYLSNSMTISNSTLQSERNYDFIDYAFNSTSNKTLRQDISNYPTQCCFCNTKPSEIPCYLSCGHVYCYFCIFISLKSDIDNHSSYKCIICNNQQDNYHNLTTQI